MSLSLCSSQGNSDMDAGAIAKSTVKTEPEKFVHTGKNGLCPVCGTRSVNYESDYPSSTEPFSSKMVSYCVDCGSGYVEDSEQLLKTYYEVDYATLNRGDREAEPREYFSDSFRDRSKKISRYFNRGSRHIELLKAFGVPFDDILDYGSGPGYFLFLSGAVNKYAFEPDTKSIKYLKYLNATRFETLHEVASTKYDGIVASHSIEHLVPEHLYKTLALLIGSLKPEGRCLIEVPQGGHSFLHLDTRQDPHTIFFTPEGIVRAVQRAGGRVLYNSAAAKTLVPTREKPIYQPRNNHFYSEKRGSLVIVCEQNHRNANSELRGNEKTHRWVRRFFDRLR